MPEMLNVTHNQRPELNISDIPVFSKGPITLLIVILGYCQTESNEAEGGCAPP